VTVLQPALSLTRTRQIWKREIFIRHQHTVWSKYAKILSSRLQENKSLGSVSNMQQNTWPPSAKNVRIAEDSNAERNVRNYITNNTSWWTTNTTTEILHCSNQGRRSTGGSKNVGVPNSRWLPQYKIITCNLWRQPFIIGMRDFKRSPTFAVT